MLIFFSFLQGASNEFHNISFHGAMLVPDS